MISREFFSWLASNWARTLAMSLIVSLITFSLVVLMGLAFHHTDLQERQTAHIERIEDAARKSKEAATKASEEASRTRQEVKHLELLIQGRDW